MAAFIALGANLGDAASALMQAVGSINALPLCVVRKASSLYKSAPLETLPGQASGGDYTNGVIEIATELPAPVLLRHLQRIETAAGRQRPYLNAPRTLDLDLLLYGDGSIASPQLTVPHPRMGQRAFVLVPLAEIAPHRVDAKQMEAVKDQSLAKASGQLLLAATHQSR